MFEELSSTSGTNTCLPARMCVCTHRHMAAVTTTTTGRQAHIQPAAALSCAQLYAVRCFQGSATCTRSLCVLCAHCYAHGHTCSHQTTTTRYMLTMLQPFLQQRCCVDLPQPFTCDVQPDTGSLPEKAGLQHVLRYLAACCVAVCLCLCGVSYQAAAAAGQQKFV